MGSVGVSGKGRPDGPKVPIRKGSGKRISRVATYNVILAPQNVGKNAPKSNIPLQLSGGQSSSQHPRNVVDRSNRVFDSGR